MWHQLPTLAEKYQCSVRPIPVLFAGFLKAYGQLGPAEIEPKSDWMNRNVWRKALELGIPVNTPARHPFNPLLLLRMTATDMLASKRESLIGHLFRSIWADQIDPTGREQMIDYLEQRGFPAHHLMASANDTRVKDRVKTNTSSVWHTVDSVFPPLWWTVNYFGGLTICPTLRNSLQATIHCKQLM